MDGATPEQVKLLLRGFMDTWIAKQYEELRSIGEDGSSPSGILAPFHDALVPGIRGLGERGFSTALGTSTRGSRLLLRRAPTRKPTGRMTCRGRYRFLPESSLPSV